MNAQPTLSTDYATMPKSKRAKSRIVIEARQAAKDLHDIGVIDSTTMRKFDALSVTTRIAKRRSHKPRL
jgi:hypothetical protein